MMPSTADRVPSSTARHVTERIRAETEANVARYGTAGPEAIERRLEELDREWDIERCVEAMAPTFSLLGLGLGLTVNRRWLALPLVVQGFLLQHAVQGWCPPVALLRRRGVRTSMEIAEERNALKALRGDYRDIPGNGSDVGAASRALRAAES